MPKQSIKSAVQEVFKLIRAEKTLVASLAEIRSKLAAYGIETEAEVAAPKTPSERKAKVVKKSKAKVATKKASKPRKPRKSRAELNEDAVLKFCGAGGKKKGEIIAHFSGGAPKVSKVLADLVKSKKLESDEVKGGKGAAAKIFKVAK